MGGAGHVLRWLTAMGLALLLMAGLAPAEAQISHQVRFVAEPQVQVWSDSSEARIGREVTLRLAEGAAEFAGGGGPVLGGQLVAVSETGGPIVQRIQVASNTGFDVVAEARSPGWRVQARLVEAGPNAQVIGGARGEVVLGRASERATLFTQRERTAARRGAPASQSVILEVRAEPLWPISGPAPLVHVICLD